MDHDESYKLLFSHPEMVADLIRGFVREDWVKDLDFGTLERVSGSFVADDLRGRESDVIWKLKLGPETLYVYLLIEFQSSVDAFMAVRTLIYVALLYQDLIRKGTIASQDKLPPVLPIVLYNGNRRWDAAEEIADLIAPAPAGLRRYLPSFRYLLLDEGRYAESETGVLAESGRGTVPNGKQPHAPGCRTGRQRPGRLAASSGAAFVTPRLHHLAEAGVFTGPDAWHRIEWHQRIARGAKHAGRTSH